MPGARMFMIVTMTLIAAEDRGCAHEMDREDRIGNEAPPWSISGGYIVQPPAGPPPGTNSEPIRMAKANGSIQKLTSCSAAAAPCPARPPATGSCQLARPVHAGMTAPKIISSACMVVIELKNCGSTNCRPGLNSSVRMISAMKPPMKNISPANTRYIVPMSL